MSKNIKYEVLIGIRRNGKLFKKGEIISLSGKEAEEFLKEDAIVIPGNEVKADLQHEVQKGLREENEKMKNDVSELENKVENLEKNQISKEEFETVQEISNFFLEKENLLKMETSLLEDLATLYSVTIEGNNKGEKVDDLLSKIAE